MKNMPTGEHRVRIRPAERKDILAIVTISLDSVSDEEVAGFGTPTSESVFGDSKRLSSAWSDPNLVGTEEIFVADMDGKVVACVTAEDRGGELELIDIDVLRGLQGHGIGTELVRYMEQLARDRGKKAVTLGTSRSASGIAWKSLPWWESRGYQITHEEENDWTRSIGPGTREIRMRKDVS